LGGRFRAEIEKVVERIANNPERYAVVYKSLRRARLQRFPYALFFSIEDKELMVVACFHSKRDPKRWQARA
jgi:plasmid stabilization system protein ParE